MSCRWLLSGLMWLLASACGEPEPVFSFKYNPKLPTRLAAAHPLWGSACDRKPSRRIGLPPGLHQEQELRPTRSEFSADLRRVIEKLPPPFAALFERHVCAVVPMYDAPMTGTLSMLAADQARGLIFLNPDLLNMPPNRWLEFKESSPFDLAHNYSLVGKLAEPDENIPHTLIEFVLVHELGHIMDQVLGDDPMIAAFKRLSWPVSEYIARRPLMHYPERNNVPRRPGHLSLMYYEYIATHDFTSPAALDNPKEDFAESIGTYMHSVLRGRPWQLDLKRDGQLAISLSSCWEEPRCAGKRALVEQLLQRWSEPEP